MQQQTTEVLALRRLLEVAKTVSDSERNESSKILDEQKAEIYEMKRATATQKSKFTDIESTTGLRNNFSILSKNNTIMSRVINAIIHKQLLLF
jgi:hypothetical protein